MGKILEARLTRSLVLLAASVLALASSCANAMQFVLSGSVDGTAPYHVDDDLDVYVNGVNIYFGTSIANTPTARAPIPFSANVGDALHLVVRDTYGGCARLSRLFLTDSIGRYALVDPGFDLGCGRPAGNQGVVHDVTLPIPNLAPAPMFSEALLPGSTVDGLIDGRDGLLYGTTYDGGTAPDGITPLNKGTIFAYDPLTSTVEVLYSLNGTTDGAAPFGLMLDPTSGKFYGTTSPPAPAPGTVFVFDAGARTLTTLLTSFAGFNSPLGLIKSGDYFYGTLARPNGAIFRMQPDGGGFTIIHQFSDFSSLPESLTVGADGLLYGKTIYGGIECNVNYPGLGCGTVFRLKPVLPGELDEQFEILHAFAVTNSVHENYPVGLNYGSDGLLYGTTYYSLFKLDPANPAATFQYLFTNGGGISLLATEGPKANLFLSEYSRGTEGAGWVYAILKDGTGLTALHNFSFTTGLKSYGPAGQLLRNGAGTLFGTTEYTDDAPYHGTVFALSDAVFSNGFGP